MILDEATSALDPLSEKEVQAAIDKIASSGTKLTILIVAHRISTIETAQSLLFFKNRNDLVSAQKGTPEYDQIMETLKCVAASYGDKLSDESACSDEELLNDDFATSKHNSTQFDEANIQDSGVQKTLNEVYVTGPKLMKPNLIENLDSEKKNYNQLKDSDVKNSEIEEENDIDFSKAASNSRHRQSKVNRDES